MLKIRFNRIGRRNKVYYRIVVQEHTAAPGGRHVAVVGSHDPHTKTTVLKTEAIQHWLSVGAQPSDTVHNLLVKNGIIRGKKRPKGKAVEAPNTEETKDTAETTSDSVAEENTEASEESEVAAAETAEASEGSEKEAKEETPAEEETKEKAEG